MDPESRYTWAPPEVGPMTALHVGTDVKNRKILGVHQYDALTNKNLCGKQ